MKTLRRFRTTINAPEEIELYERGLDALLRIENRGTEATIRAAREVPEGVKDALVRYLAREGFVAAEPRWGGGGASQVRQGVNWVTDGSWVRFKHRRHRAAAQVWAYLTWGRWLSLGLFVVALAVALWFKHH